MWVYDGEDWTQEGGTPSPTRPETAYPQRFDELVPELQVVVEIVPIRQKRQVPPVPFP